MRKIISLTYLVILSFSIIACNSNTTPINGGKYKVPTIVVDFTFQNAGGLTVAFTDKVTATSVIKSRSWEFGDGRKSGDINPTHQYTTAGNYAITLTIIDSKSKVYKRTKAITVSEFGVTDSLVDFSAETVSGSTIKFNNNITPTNVTIIGRGWEFGDGVVSNEISPTHSYLYDGDYNIKITVTDSNGTEYSITKVVSVKSAILAVGAESNLLLKVSGEIYNWGEQLGSIPIELTYFNDNDIVIKSVVAGGYHKVAISEDGKIYAWGRNEHGQLGLGSSADQTTPTLIQSFPNGTVVKSVAVGGFHTVALTEDGKVYSWGRNDYGQLGIGAVSVDRCGASSSACAKTPQEVTFAGGAVINKIIAGGYHNFSVTDNGKVYAWGDNEFGQLGLGDVTIDQCTVFIKSCSKTPRELVFNEAIKSITAGVYHSLAISDIGNLYSWGDSAYGQLGFNSISDINIPSLLSVEGKAISFATAGEFHSVAITEDSKVYAWGRNHKGQLGLNDNIDRLSPEHLLALDGKEIRYIKSGYNFNIAVTFGDKLFSWGDSSNGQLGLGNIIADSCNGGDCVKSPTILLIN